MIPEMNYAAAEADATRTEIQEHALALSLAAKIVWPKSLSDLQ
jgi:hypothetical protein